MSCRLPGLRFLPIVTGTLLLMDRVIEICFRGPLVGEVRPPSDKSLTHRAYIFAAMASKGEQTELMIDGPGAVIPLPIPSVLDSQIDLPLRGEDCESTLGCLAALGQNVSAPPGHVVKITGGHPWISPTKALDCGNSGTTMRLMAGLLAGLPGVESTLVGDASLSRRPMGRVAEPLRLMGASITGANAPLTIVGQSLNPISYASPVASAQVKSCVLIAGLAAHGVTWVSEPSKSRDHTERMFRALGVELKFDGDLRIGIEGGQTWGGFQFRVPADISSAAFTMVAAACLPGSNLTLRQVGVNPTRTGIVDVFAEAGIPVVHSNQRDELGEPTADVTITAPAVLNAFQISGELVPRLIDEIPVLAVLATQCRGRTMIRDAHELRVKESDRIQKMAEGLTAMGARVEVFDDGLGIEGPTPLEATNIAADGDHRIAMAFAVAGLLASGTTRISGAESIATSYPTFETDLDRLLPSPASDRN